MAVAEVDQVFGPLTVRFAGDGKFYAAVTRAFGTSDKPGNSMPPDMLVRIHETPGRGFSGTFRSGRVEFDHMDYAFEDRVLRCEVRHESGVMRVLDVYPVGRGNQMYRITKQFQHWAGSFGVRSAERYAAHFLSYSFFWSLLHLALLKKNAAFIHAGLIAQDSAALMVTGTGGAGKTSLTFEMLSADDSCFLSEDFGIIDANGQSYFSPKPMLIYASDVARGNPLLVSAANQQIAFAKWRWDVLKAAGLNPTFRIAPSELLEAPRIAAEATLQCAVFAVRMPEGDIRLKEVSAEEITQRCLAAAFRELKPLYEIHLQIEAAGYTHTEIPTMSALETETQTVYRTAFAKSRNSLLTIPQGTKVTESAAVIRGACDGF